MRMKRHTSGSASHHDTANTLVHTFEPTSTGKALRGLQTCFYSVNGKEKQIYGCSCESPGLG